MKLKMEFFIIPIIFFLIILGIIFFEIIKNIKEPKIKIDFKNLTNQEKEDLKEAYQVLFQIKLMKKELKNKEVPFLKEKINQFEKKLLEEKDLSQIKKISQDFWDSSIWQEIYQLEK